MASASGDNEMPPQDDDIRQAVNQAHQLGDSAGSGTSGGGEPISDTLVQSKSCPLLGIRYGISKCGMMAEKYPWQTTAVLLLATGCGWVCSYFGLTVLAAMLIYALCAEE